MSDDGWRGGPGRVLLFLGSRAPAHEVLLSLPFPEVLIEVDLAASMERWLRGDAPLLLVDAAGLSSSALSALCLLRPLRSRGAIVLLCRDEEPLADLDTCALLPVVSVAGLASLFRRSPGAAPEANPSPSAPGRGAR